MNKTGYSIRNAKNEEVARFDSWRQVRALLEQTPGCHIVRCRMTGNAGLRTKQADLGKERIRKNECRAACNAIAKARGLKVQHSAEVSEDW